jgi:hypothetical protein
LVGEIAPLSVATGWPWLPAAASTTSSPLPNAPSSAVAVGRNHAAQANANKIAGQRVLFGSIDDSPKKTLPSSLQRMGLD